MTCAMTQSAQPASLSCRDVPLTSPVCSLMHRMDLSSGAVVGVHGKDFATAMKVSDQNNNNGQSERHGGRVKSLNADRQRVRALLEERMRKCQVHDCHSKLRLQAAALEEAIYCQIRHQQLHQQTEALVFPHDEASLNLQLGHLLRRLAQQQRRRRATNTIHHKDTPRARALRECLGKVRYARLQSLLLQIQNLGVAHSFCGGGSCSTKNNKNQTLQGNTKAPQPIRQLFFQTRLVPAVNQTPVPQLASITTSQWDGWLDEAERHIRGYHVWSQQYDGRESGCPPQRALPEC